MALADDRAAATADTVRERLKAHFDGLSRQQRNIATYLLDHLNEVPFLSVPKLAERTGASEATVVRLCQSIGFSGFSALKRALVESLREEGASPVREAGDQEAPRDPIELVAELDRHNIRRTVERADRAAFTEIAEALCQADHIFTFGLGVSAHLAAFAAYQFTEHGLRSHCLETTFSTPREQLVTLRPGDLLFVFSFPPYSRQALEVLEEGKRRRLATVAITDRPSAPAAVLADHALVAASDGVLLNNSTTGSLLLLNALLVEVASRHQGKTVEALSRINRILESQDFLVDGEG